MAISNNNKPAHLKPVEKFDFFHDERVRSVFYQFLTLAFVVGVGWYLFTTTAHNLEVRGMGSGFDFLGVEAGFDPDFKLVAYEAGVGTYGDIFIIGILNTIYISFLSIIATTILGFTIGVLRLSSNWLVAKVALAYVEVFRNTPLLIQVVFWYIGIFSLLPKVNKSIDLSGGSGSILLNNRGLYMPWPEPGELLWLTGLALVIAIAATVVIRRWAHKRQDETGKTFPAVLLSIGLIVLLPTATYFMTGSPLGMGYPDT